VNAAISLMPIFAIFILLFLLRQSAVKAGVVSYFVAVFIALFVISGQLGFLDIIQSTLKGILISSVVAYQPEAFAFSQNTSASHMTMASPSRVLLGVSVCGIQAEESRLLRIISLIAIGGLAIVILGMMWYA
jgi:L-lactate permease